MRFSNDSKLLRPALAFALLLGLPCTAQNQQPGETGTSASSVNASLGELQSQVRELKELVLHLQQQTVASRAEISRLRQDLEAQRGSTVAAAAGTAGDEPSPAHLSSTTEQLGQHLDHIEEDQQLLSAKIDEQHQTKLESASKYRVRFSGIVLFNLFANRGSVDNQDVPTWALDQTPGNSSGSFGGTLRQSILGFEVFGPQVFGARSSGNVNLDFGGGFPATYNGVNMGLTRLRTASLRLDWKDTSLIVGQDQLLLAPVNPTSFASLIVPALSYAGNLWAWTPQLRVEHRFALADDSTLTLQGGVLDPLTGQPPDSYNQYTWYRAPDAGEQSRQPAFAARVAYSHPMQGQTFTLGAGGYYSRQDWGFNRNVNGYAATLDLSMPLYKWFSLSGAFYRGAAIGGLGAALGRSVMYDGPLADPNTLVRPLNSVGGWAQLKFRPTPKLEFNAAVGDDNPFAADVRAFGEQSFTYGDPYVTANRQALGNVIYRPRSDVLFSLQYLHLRTFSIYDYSNQANQVNLSMGILF